MTDKPDAYDYAAERKVVEKVKDLAGCRATAEMWEKLGRTDLIGLYNSACFRAVIAKVIRARLAKCQQERPIGYLVREAPAEDVKNLQQLAGHLTENWFITKFRKIFARDEMNDDLAIVPARYNGAEDVSEYEEILPSSPP